MHTYVATTHSEHGNDEQCMHIVNAYIIYYKVKIVYKMGSPYSIIMNYVARALLKAMLII